MIDLESGCMCVKFYFRFLNLTDIYILYKDIETYA